MGQPPWGQPPQSEPKETISGDQENFSRVSNYADLLASFLDNGEDIIVRNGSVDNNFLLVKVNIVGGDWHKVSYCQPEQSKVLTARAIRLGLLESACHGTGATAAGHLWMLRDMKMS
jgi:hypothetical protein